MTTAPATPTAVARTRRSAGVLLVGSDIDLLAWLYRFRLANIEHLAAVTKRSYKKTHGRLLKLHQQGFLARLTPPLEKHIYTLAKRGVAALVQQGAAPREELDKRLRHTELRPMFLAHELMITEIHSRVVVESRSSSRKLIAWDQSKDLWDKVEIIDGGAYREQAVRPDGFFILKDTSRPEGKKRAYFFLEADRSTTTHERFKRKLLAYWRYLAGGHYSERYGHRTFRVLTITLTEERAQNLCRLAHDTLPAEAHLHFLFSPLAGIVPGILGDAFLRPDMVSNGS